MCSLRIAVNDQVKDQASGEWVEKANYFTVDVFGRQAETCAQYLNRGRQVAVSGRLRWRQWETQDGQKRNDQDLDGPPAGDFVEAGDDDIPF